MNGHAAAHYTYAAPVKASRSGRDGRNGGGGAQSADQVMSFRTGLQRRCQRSMIYLLQVVAMTRQGIISVSVWTCKDWTKRDKTIVLCRCPSARKREAGRP